MRLKFNPEQDIQPVDPWPWCVCIRSGRKWMWKEWPREIAEDGNDNYAYYASTNRALKSIRWWCK